MGSILFVIIILCILIYYPEVVLLAGLIIGGICFAQNYKVVKKDAENTNKDEDDLEDWSPQKAAEKEVKERLKTGYQDDPEWKEKSKKISDHQEQMQKIADLEMEIDELKEQLEQDSDPITAKIIEERKKLLKTLEKRAGIHRTSKEIPKPSQKVQDNIDHSRELTDQEIYEAMQELND